MTWHQAPFIRLLLPLILGIVAACYLPSSVLGFEALVFFALSLIPLSLWAWQKKLSVRQVKWGGIVLLLSVFSLGYLLCVWQDPRNRANHLQTALESGEKQFFSAIVASEPQLKGKSIQADLAIITVKDSLGNEKKVQGTISASFELDTFSTKLVYGSGLQFRAELKPTKGAENPHGFDAAAYLQLKGIFHQTYIKSGKWQPLAELDGGNPIWKIIIAWRQQLSRIFDRHLNAFPNENAVASALVLGSRSNFSSDLKNAYADTGATHVLSVSGLHVGLVAALLGWILERLRSKKNAKKGNKAEVLILLLAIWFYALLTGASASVLRSAVMFSFVVLGRAFSQKTSIYNTLAASAFFLLCWQPTMLWDIGFQLSYLALGGIVYFHPIIYKKIYIANKIGDWAWNLTAVGIAAQIATLPLSFFYFHQFPFYFWLSGLAVIPLSTVALYAGIALLALSWVPFLSTFIGWIFYASLALMNACIFAIQQLPLAVIDGFWIEAWEMWLWYLVIATASMAFIYKKKNWTLITMSLVFISALHQFYQIYTASTQEKLFVYKVYKGTTLDFVKGQKALTLTDSMQTSAQKLEFLHQNNLYALRVRNLENTHILHHDSISNDMLYLSSRGLGRFGAIDFAIPATALLSPPFSANEPLKVDYLILRGNPKIKEINSLEEAFNYNCLVFDASNSPYRIASWRQQCAAEGIPFIDCSEKGQELPAASQRKNFVSSK